ncbi:MAG: maleylpyruvate isomerase N-terminal domain-containing protein [Lacibacter sp.]
MQQQVIHTKHLFPVLDAKLIELLRSLTSEEWNKPTIARLWTVKDIAAHLLDGNIRTLSLGRDRHQLLPNRSINHYNDLVDYLNELNAVWVKASKRLSPQLLTDLLELTGKQYSQYWQEADLYADALFSVAWAGEQTSRNWFHIAREYTEKFIHQQQIREAVNKPGIITQELFYPFIETFMQALPYTYRSTDAEINTTVKVSVSTEAGGNWFLIKNTDGWYLSQEATDTIAASVEIDPATAWKLFSKGITPDEAKSAVTITGNKKLGETVLTMVSVMA